jgi:hypothetical protein
MHAEAGSEWQGTWVNNIGQTAAIELEKIIRDFAEDNNLVAVAEPADPTPDESLIVLKSGTTIAFGSEPDVEIRNAKKELVCVIEIKGSTDKQVLRRDLERPKSLSPRRRLRMFAATQFSCRVSLPQP